MTEPPPMTAPSRERFSFYTKKTGKRPPFPVFSILLPFFIAHAGLSGLDETLAGDMLYLQAEHADLIHGAVGVPFRADGGILVADDLRATDFLLTIFDLFKFPDTMTLLYSMENSSGSTFVSCTATKCALGFTAKQSSL